MSGRKIPVWQRVRRAAEALGPRFTNADVRDWVLERWPDTKKVTINDQIVVCTVNHESRAHYPENHRPRISTGRYDFLFRPERGSGKLELYDPAIHGLWELAAGDGKVLVVRRIEGTAWIVQRWAPLVVDPDLNKFVWAQERQAELSERVQVGDEIFVYETAGGPRTIVYSDGSTERLVRRTGRRGVVARLAIVGERRETGSGQELYDGAEYHWKYRFAARAYRTTGFVSLPELRRVLGWKPNAPPRNLSLRPLTAEQAAALRERLSPGAPRPRPEPSRDEQLERLTKEAEARGEFQPGDEDEAVERALAAVAVRRGQPKFRADLLNAYGARCAVTDCDYEGGLEAAHIQPYRGKRTNHIGNGLLLRADIHTLFDRGLIGIDPGCRHIVIHADLHGTVYEALAETRLRVPRERRLRPSQAALDAHLVEHGLSRCRRCSE